MEPEQVRDLGGKYVIPGFVDCHMHIESTMAAPRTFMKGAVRNGVTTLIAEPHEIANVFGLAGIQAMAKTMQALVTFISLFPVPYRQRMNSWKQQGASLITMM
jgi:adenine deaminase